MSFLTDITGVSFIRDLWPARLRRRIGTDPKDAASAEDAHLVVPVDSLSLSEWLRVMPRKWPAIKDRSRPYTVVHAPDINEDTEEQATDLFEFKLRVQGFLGAHDLGHLGTWSKKPLPDRIAKAVQYLELHGGDDADCQLAWNQTVERINHLTNVIANVIQVGKYEPTFNPDKGKIHFQRRVFIRGEPQDGYINTPIPHQVSHLEDAVLAAAKKGWFLNVNPNAFGQVTRKGYLVRTTNFPFQEGNFVDVTAALDIVRRNNEPLAVKLRIEKVVLLDTAGAGKKRTIPRAAPAIKQRDDMVFFDLEDLDDDDVVGEASGSTSNHGGTNDITANHSTNSNSGGSAGTLDAGTNDNATATNNGANTIATGDDTSGSGVQDGAMNIDGNHGHDGSTDDSANGIDD